MTSANNKMMIAVTLKRIRVPISEDPKGTNADGNDTFAFQ